MTGVKRAAALALGWAALAAPLRAQELADFDYENLAFRGFGVEVGRLWANKVESMPTYGVRMDLGYLGPALRITPSLTYWSSRMKGSEVASLEDRMESLVAREQPAGAPYPSVTLGPIDWSDIVVALDAHAVWRTPYDVLTFAGAGAAVHFLNGDGASINGTFVEDLLDSVGAGFDLHAGLEYALHPKVRLYGMGRLEVLQDIHYAAVRGGVQILLGPAAPGEENPR
ncbi:MAG: hypothetical protein EXR95_09140 [Gemmatimonadetes bacterium]|nr:hypothetical protein [Gemmatimonadota bacterium]